MLPAVPLTFVMAAIPMPFEFVIDRQDKVIRETWTGRVDLEQLQDSCRTEWAHPDYQKQMHMVSDFRGATVELTASEIWTFVRWFGAQEVLAKHALVVSREVGFGLARMYSSISEDTRKHFQSLRIFYSLAEAEEWITND